MLVFTTTLESAGKWLRLQAHSIMIPKALHAMRRREGGEGGRKRREGGGREEREGQEMRRESCSKVKEREREREGGRRGERKRDFD